MRRWGNAALVWAALVGCADPLATQEEPHLNPVAIGPRSEARSPFRAVAASVDVVFVATHTAVHRSFDAGETWTLIRQPELYDVSSMVVRDGEVFAATPGHVYYSADDGETWRETKDESGWAVRGGYLTARASDVYVTHDASIQRWNATTARWERVPADASGIEDGFIPEVIESDGSAIFATRGRSREGGVYRLDLDAAGAAWTRVESLHEWGYLAYVFTDELAITASAHEVFSREPSAEWTPIAELPGVTDLLAHQGSLYAAASDGVHESVDRGRTWTRVWSEPCTSKFALASDGAHVFAVTEESLLRGRDGVWERIDLRADEVWQLASTGDAVLSISAAGFRRGVGDDWSSIDAVPSSRLPIVVHGGGVFVLDRWDRVLASTDGGRSFTHSESPWGILRIFVSSPWGLVGFGSGRLLLSTDGARSWSPITPVSITPPVHNLQRLFVIGSDLFGATLSYGLYRTRDRAQSWEPVALDTDVPIDSLVAIDGTLFASAGALWRSEDDGVTWERIAFEGMNVSALIAHGDRLFAGVGSITSFDGGVYVSTDLGESWTLLDPSFTARVSALAMHEGTLYIGTLDQSTWSVALDTAD
jgi:photosystem II stability/assembly factor-like uncharacterized protein